ALSRKYNPNSARPRVFDGAAEAKLIALTCSPAPEGFARWSLRLLEEKVVELNIVEKASDNTIGRTLKKTASSLLIMGSNETPLLGKPVLPTSSCFLVRLTGGRFFVPA